MSKQLNNWLTIFANLSVLVGLVFVGIEIRQNTNVARANAYRDNVQDIAAWRTTIASDPDLSRAYAKYMDEGMDALEGDERRIGWLLNNIIGIYENAYYAHQLGIIGDAEYSRFEQGACLHYQARVQRDRFARANRWLSAEFQAYLDTQCEPGTDDESP